MGNATRPTIAELWESSDASTWDGALADYWNYVRPENLELERQLENLDVDRLQQLDGESWYEFLRDGYFRWKYTAPNRYATTTNALRRHYEEKGVEELLSIKDRLLSPTISDIRYGLSVATEIPGLGIAGASGLLALMYPQTYGTVDQFCVKALKAIPALPEAKAVGRIKEQAISLRNGEILVEIMQRKATINSLVLGAPWTPRMIDKVLWTYGR